MGGQSVTHRYVHDGQQVIQRETTRSQSFWNRLVAGGARIPSRTDVTRIINTPGPTVYLDSDGTVDVQMPDRFGRPWFMYRAREDDHYDFNRGTEWDFLRDTGMLKPPPFPENLYLEYPPFHAVVVENDVMLGRRGRHGWMGQSFNSEKRLLGVDPPEDDFEPPAAWQYWLGGLSEGELAAPVSAGRSSSSGRNSHRAKPHPRGISNASLCR